jgi:hypothetical protein
MKLFGEKEKKNRTTQLKPSAPLGNHSLPPPQNPNYVSNETEFKGRLECSINHNLGRIDIIVSHEKGGNKQNLLNDFLEKVKTQVDILKRNNVNATIKSIDIFLNVEFNLSKSIRETLSGLNAETLSRLNVETFGAITLNLLLNGEEVNTMSSFSQNRITEIVADIEDADVFKSTQKTRVSFDAICAKNEIKITFGGNLWTSDFKSDKSNHKSAPKAPIKRKNRSTKTT